ncbi:hypothetical protein [Haloglomus litoreum]|uniref:hypothetical protein n=1 Tax=Haloglomus litoreum TaxID=3034026 RepID=UPI003B218F3E
MAVSTASGSISPAVSAYSAFEEPSRESSVLFASRTAGTKSSGVMGGRSTAGRLCWSVVAVGAQVPGRQQGGPNPRF